jgi:hypothetical protein
MEIRLPDPPTRLEKLAGKASFFGFGIEIANHF